MNSDPLKTSSRRALLARIGAGVGGAAVYRLMTSLGFAAPSTYRGPLRLEGDPRGASVLVLGAGLAGMTAAYELRRAGYKVQALEYNQRPGGRNWTVRGGDVYIELGGARQVCGFDDGQYLNPGPWRIPHHHYAVLDYCRRLGVALEPFVQLNHNAYLHKPGAFGGAPKRIREIKADFSGGVAELLAKATNKGALDDEVTKEDREILLEALRGARRARSRLPLPRRPDRLRISRLRAPARRRPLGPPQGWRADRAQRYSDLAAVGRLAELSDLRIPDHDVSAGRRHGQDRRGFWARTRRCDPLQRQGRRDRAGRARRRGALRGFFRRRRDGDGPRRLVHLHAAAQHSQPNAGAGRRADARGDLRSALCAGGESGIAILPPFLGGRRAHLRRHILHRSGDPPDRLSQLRLQQARQGRAARRLSVRRGERL